MAKVPVRMSECASEGEVGSVQVQVQVCVCVCVRVCA